MEQWPCNYAASKFRIQGRTHLAIYNSKALRTSSETEIIGPFQLM